MEAWVPSSKQSQHPRPCLVPDMFVVAAQLAQLNISKSVNKITRRMFVIIIYSSNCTDMLQLQHLNIPLKYTCTTDKNENMHKTSCANHNSHCSVNISTCKSVMF
jgi:hypothetical protein